MGLTKHLTPEKKVIICKLLKYFESISKGETQNISMNESKSSLVSRVSEICGVSERSVWRISSEEKEGGDSNLEATFSKAERKQRLRPKTNLSEETLDRIRHLLYNYHISDGKIITVSELCAKIRDTLQFNLSAWSLRCVFKKLGFKYLKTKNNRIKMIENSSIVAKRNAYLATIAYYRSLGRPIIYLDETYVHHNYSTFKMWQDNTSEGFHPKIGKGQRFIVGESPSLLPVTSIKREFLYF